MLDRGLVQSIKSKHDSLVEDPLFHLQREARIRGAFTSENKPFSWPIEHPDIRHASRCASATQLQRGRLIRCAREAVSRLDDAWHYLVGHDKPLSEEALHGVARKVEPHSNNKGYRVERVSLQLNSYVPPNPLKVPFLVAAALSEASVSGDREHPVERAALAHLRLVGIQPFNAGNKRIARLIQSKILYDAHLPPAIIPAFERHNYLSILESALVSMRDGLEEGQKRFVNFIGGKVDESLSNILTSVRSAYRTSVYATLG